MQRFTPYETFEQLHSMLVDKTPDTLQLGCVMPGNPARPDDTEKRQTDRMLLSAGTVESPGGPLILDIDLDAFPRTCACHKHTCCNTCWLEFIPTARRITEYWLREVWNFKRILCVFSGSRGVHFWVLDERVICWSNMERASFIKSLAEPVDRTGVVPRFLSEELFATHYPRYDLPVSASAYHLKKLPMLPHQTTRKLAIPLPPVDGRFVWKPEDNAFSPSQVTLDVINQWLNVAQRELGIKE